ncbi:hypothetical protein OUZ56_025940 [Daphnia magna]|uniref:Uncharacterized protein n=1 Tax=Daphnia magna TaxID=35525 RepID=A0ABQ9ZKF3_9CRUS|nr:hypothetical protein OUZ56_025940 [Daphnia magna]
MVSIVSYPGMTLLKENIQELMNQCLYHHSRYLSAIAPTGDSLNTEEQWAIRTDTAAHDAFKLIDDYLNTIQFDETPNGGVKRPANDKESSLEITNPKDTSGPDDNSMSFDNRPETIFPDPPPRPLNRSTPFDNPPGATLPNPPPRSADYSGSSGFNWLSTMLPRIEITLFNGDPRLWRSFSRSFKELVHEVLPSDAQRIVALKTC